MYVHKICLYEKLINKHEMLSKIWECSGLYAWAKTLCNKRMDVRADWKQLIQRKKGASMRYFKIGMFALAPARCPDHRPRTSKASSSSWDVDLRPSFEATQPKWTIVFSHHLGVLCSLAVLLCLVQYQCRVSAAIKTIPALRKKTKKNKNLKASLP